MSIERRALQGAIAAAALVPVVAGSVGVLDPALLDFAARASTLTHTAYLSGLLLGIGLSFWATIPAIERRGQIFKLMTFLVVLGGLARLLTAFRLGIWSPSVTLPLIMELVVTPSLWLWQRRISARC
jgi:Domain of unknown function (DUF4345)